MSIYKVSLGGRRAYWKPEQNSSDTHQNQLSLKLDLHGHPVAVYARRPQHFDQLRKMMRRFKALKRSPIAKSTQSLNNLDYVENPGGSSRQFVHSPVSSRYTSNQENDQNLDDDSSVLDGMIDLSVLLPDGRHVRMPIDARTPMMDVLVHVTTGNGINAGGMMLKVPIDRPPGYLHYKPNMAIGKLGCTTVEVVPKAAVCERPRKQVPKGANLPFEPTIRIQVDLPKNQKTVLRVSPQLTLGEILNRICHETNLEPLSAYELRAAKSIAYPLNLERRLGETGIVDFAIVPLNSGLCKSTSDLLGTISKMSQEEKEKRKTRRFFGLLKRKPKAPQPAKMEIQKTTLNGQAAVEMRTPEKPKRATPGKERPMSVPPNFFESSDGEASTDQSQNKRDASAVKPKKRQAPPPPPPPPADQTQPKKEDESCLKNEPMDPSTNSVRSQHARRGSDSSSGYHGSSQPSPNPPAIVDTVHAAVSSVRNVSGSEKLSFSYKSETSGEGGSTLQNRNQSKEDSQKKKQKAPMPPPAADSAGTDLNLGTKRSPTSSPDAERSSIAKEDGFLSDTRCSSPATVEDVDKSFQEVIQQIQKQISAEDDAAAAEAEAAREECKDALAAPIADDVTQFAESNMGVDSTRVNDDGSNQRVSPAALVTETSKPKLDDGDTSTPKSTRKPTNLDEPVVTSYAELRLSWSKDDKPNTPEPTPVLPPMEEQIPIILPLQSDGLLMIKPSQDEKINDAEKIDQHPASRTDIEENRKETSISNQSITVATSDSDSGHREMKPIQVDANISSPKAAASPVRFQQPNNSWTSPVGKPMSPLYASISPLPSAMSPRPTGVSSQHSSASSPRSTIVYNDPKKGQYPSMQVKSFEDEYYTKSQSSVASDYVKAVRYGMVAEFSSSKEDREKNKDKLEATVAKRANTVDDRWRVKPHYSQPTGIPARPVESKPTANRAEGYKNVDQSIQGSSKAVPQSHDDINIRLQREYEKLQAMFADWQFRLKQNESNIESGRKLSLEQSLAFQRLQDEMMQQHRYVQDLCAQVQRMEKEPATTSTAAQNKERSENIRTATRSMAMMNNAIHQQKERRSSGSIVAAKKVFVENMDVPSNGALKRNIMASPENTGKKFAMHDQPKVGRVSVEPTAVKPSMLWSTKKAFPSSNITDPTATLSSEAVGISTMIKKPMENIGQPKPPTNGHAQSGLSSFKFNGISPTMQPPIAQAQSQPTAIEPIVKYAPAHSPTAPPAPPPPPIMPPPPIESKPRPPSSLGLNTAKQPIKATNVSNTSSDPRNDLMASIRNFGGSGGLRKTPVNDDRR